MAEHDFYQILGVSRSASMGEIKSAFRRLAVKNHPDKNPGDKGAEDRFKRINAAYQVLSDKERRAAYDQYGHAAFQQGGASDFDFANSMSEMFDDLFGDILGGRSGGRSPSRGADVRYDLTISLEDAFNGKAVKLTLPTLVACDSCQGFGAGEGSRPVPCTTCGGHGRVRAASGFFSIERTCPKCMGEGHVVDNPCTACGGSGRAQKKRTLSVSVPAGVEDGTRIRLAGEGEAGLRKAPSGDLYVFLAIKPHKVFQREGATLRCRVPIPMTTAALGGTIEVPTIDGKREEISLPAGTQGGKEIRLRNRGMTVMRRRDRGDMIVQVGIEIPCNLSDRQIKILREFESEIGEENSPETRSFFDRVKHVWDRI